MFFKQQKGNRVVLHCKLTSSNALLAILHKLDLDLQLRVVRPSYAVSQYKRVPLNLLIACRICTV